MSELHIGRLVDPQTGETTTQPATYDANRLVTHAVGVGMTGSGKTGLCISLLEELAQADVPLLIIDPKGDMANLALLFDDFDPGDFTQWSDPGEAKRAGRSPSEHGEHMASRWKRGLADSGIDGQQIRALRDKMALTVYTPGSNSGSPVDVLGAFSPPSDTVLRDETARRELITGTVSGLLGLVDIEADPVRDPEHVVLSRIVDEAWRIKESLDLYKLIERLVDPPFERIGVFSVDEFFPPRQRRKLAMKLNGIIAAPAFEPWTRGAPLDIEAMTTTRHEGGRTKVPVSLFYLAHLDDRERMFFAALLLEQVVAWSRAQGGTSSLRALVYFDEVFGYLPPYPKNPATKTPILTLMKQARAVGVGTVLVTQNPVDVDYKALSNAGTWFIGKLQTQRDRERVMDGLLASGGNLSRADVDAMLDKLRTRVFLLHDVKSDGPRLFHTRWAMSFLRGPIARREVEALMASDRLAAPPRRTQPVASQPERQPRVVATGPSRVPVDSPRRALAAAQVVSSAAVRDNTLSIRIVEQVALVQAAETAAPAPTNPRHMPPAAPTGIPYAFLREEVAHSARMGGLLDEFVTATRADRRTHYKPALFAIAELRFDEKRAGFDLRERQHRLFFPLSAEGLPSRPLWPAFREDDITTNTPENGWFDALPAAVDEQMDFVTVREKIARELVNRQSRGMWLNRALGLYGRPAETRVAFLARCSLAAERRADDQITQLRVHYAERTEALQRALRAAYEELATLHASADRLHHEALAAAADNVMSVFTGTDMPADVRAGWLKVRGAKTVVTQIDEKLQQLETDLTSSIAAIREQWEPQVGQVEEHQIRLDRKDINFPFLGVLWLPVTRYPVS